MPKSIRKTGNLLPEVDDSFCGWIKLLHECNPDRQRKRMVGSQGGGGGTLKFSVYIGEADFFGVKILNFRIFLGFQKN